METEIIKIRPGDGPVSEEDEENLRAAGAILQQGGLVAFPTETVYGLGGDALNPSSSQKIYAAKGRPSDNPLIVHIYRFEDIYKITKEVPEEARKIADAFWPGPLTMILPKSDAVPYETTGGLDTVAIRMPSHPAAQKLIKYSGGYIAAPSANTSGKPSPTVAKYVEEDMMGRIDAIIDGGEVGIGLESTIIDLTVTPPQILRPGYITQEKLSTVLGTVDTDTTILRADSGQAPKAHGMKYRHYAPKAELTIFEGENEKVVSKINELAVKYEYDGLKVGILSSNENEHKYAHGEVVVVGSRENEHEVAAHLFDVLRHFDHIDVDVILSEGFSEDSFGQAVMNRLIKAAGHHIEIVE